MSLSRKGEKKIVRYVHRLMAIAFLDNPDKKTQVNHIDGNKSNYNIENLEWVDCSENTLHAFKLGLRKVPNEMKIKVFQHDIYVGSFNSQAAAARSVGVSSAYFSSMILKGVIKSKKGFSFEVIIND